MRHLEQTQSRKKEEEKANLQVKCKKNWDKEKLEWNNIGQEKVKVILKKGYTTQKYKEKGIKSNTEKYLKQK